MRVLYIAKRNLIRHLQGTIRNIIAVSIPSLIIVLLLGFIGGMEKDLSNAIINYLAGDVRIQNKAFSENEVFNPSYYLIDDASVLVESLSQHKDVEAVSQKLFIPISIQQDNNFESIQLVGVDFNLEQKYNQIESLIIKGKIPQNVSQSVSRGKSPHNKSPHHKREILVGKETAEALGVKIGDTITFLGSTVRRGQNAMSVQVVGIIEYPSSELNKKKFVISLEDAQRFFKSPNAVTEIDIKKKAGVSYASFLKDIKKTLAALPLTTTLEIKIWKDVNDMYTMIVVGRMIYFFIGFIFCLLGSLVVYNTMYLSLFSRKFELGVLNAMGFTNTMIRKMFKIEVLIIVLCGSILGVLGGNILILIMGHTGINFEALGSSMEGSLMSNIQYPYINIILSLVVFVYTTIICFLVGAFPIRMLKKETVMSLLKSEA